METKEVKGKTLIIAETIEYLNNSGFFLEDIIVNSIEIVAVFRDEYPDKNMFKKIINDIDLDFYISELKLCFNIDL